MITRERANIVGGLVALCGVFYLLLNVMVTNFSAAPAAIIFVFLIAVGLTGVVIYLIATPLLDRWGVGPDKHDSLVARSETLLACSAGLALSGAIGLLLVFV